MIQSFLNPREVIHSSEMRYLGNVVDIGAGCGHWNNELEQKASRVISIDKNQNALSRNTLFSKEHFKIVHDLNKGVPLPLSDDTIDTALISTTLSDLSQEGRMMTIKELSRILKPTGKAFIIDWKPEVVQAIGLSHIHTVKEEDMVKLFHQEGFSINSKSLYTGGYHYGFVIEH